MKTLANKTNPAIKIITDALLSDGDNYITSFCSVPKYNWTLVEEEPVDLDKEIDKYCEPIQAWQIQEAPYTSIENCARHFYELGLKARKGE